MPNLLAVAKWVSTSRGVAFSAALTAGIVVLLLLTSGKASAVSLSIDGLSGASITQGQNHDFTLELNIPVDELIPIQTLQLTMTGTGTASGTNINVTFDPFGNVITSDPHIILALCQTVQSGSGYGYGYGYQFGNRVGYRSGYGYSYFGYGYGYGYGYVSPFVTQLRYCVTLKTGASPVMPVGGYNAQFILNTGDVTTPTFSSDVVSFQVVAAVVGTPTATPTVTPTPTPSPTPTLPPPTAAQVGEVAQQITGLAPGAAAQALAGVSDVLAAKALEQVTAAQAADILEAVDVQKAAAILDNIDATKGAQVLAQIEVEKAADIIERASSTAAARIIEKVTVSVAVAILARVEDAAAGAVISKVETKAAAAIVENLVAAKAATVMDNVEPKAAGAILGTVSDETRNALVQNMTPAALTNALAETPVDAIKKIDLTLLFQNLPQVPASSLAIVDPPKVDPALPAPKAVQVSPTLVVYETQTGELVWATLVGSPAPIDKILSKFKRALPGVKVEVEDVISVPASVPAVPDRQKPIEYFRVTVQNATVSDILAGHITFYVRKDVLDANKLHKWSILLQRYDEASGKWLTYETTRVREDATRVYYSAVVPSFSLFAISGDTVPTPVRLEASDLTQSKTEVREGKTVTIQAKVKNVTASENTFQVNLWLNNAIEATQAVTLAAGKSTTVTFTTAGSVGTNNVRIEKLISSFKVIAAVVGDATDDGIVDVRDVAVLASAFGTKTGDARFAAGADLNRDGVIDVKDVAILAANFGKGKVATR